MRTSLLSLIGLGALALSAATFAADAPAPAASAAKHRGPPQAAIDACAGKTEGTAVTWTGKSGQARSGSCKTHHGVMAARGAHRHHHPHAPGRAASAPGGPASAPR